MALPQDGDGQVHACMLCKRMTCSLQNLLNIV